MNHDPTTLFSRERLAGLDRERVERARVAVCGVGAVGTNLALSAALLGLDTTFLDPGFLEASNAPRAPLVALHDVGRAKAEVVAERAAALSYATDPEIEYAIAAVEDLGLGVFENVDVVVSAVDTLAARAYLSETSCSLGLPFVEVGFSGSALHVTAFANRDADGPCFRCLHPEVAPSSEPASCTLYARAVEAAGMTPAIQTAAAIGANLALEAALAFIHGQLNDLDGVYYSLDVRSWRGERHRIPRRASCPGRHARLPDPIETDLGVTDAAAGLLAGSGCRSLRLPGPFVVRAPCAGCGMPITVHTPLRTAPTPRCARCSPGGQSALLEIVHELREDDALLALPLAAFGFAPRDLVRAERRDGREICLRLAGTRGEIVSTIPRSRETRESA